MSNESALTALVGSEGYLDCSGRWPETREGVLGVIRKAGLRKMSGSISLLGIATTHSFGSHKHYGARRVHRAASGKCERILLKVL